jgi:hypothetical protein
VAIALIVVLGAVALAADIGVFYWQWSLLQKGTDAGALAGASFLPLSPDTATEQARDYALRNGVMPSEITAATVSEDRLSITVDAERTVPYYFGRVLGLTTGIVRVSATAQVPFAPGKIGGSPTSGTDGMGNGDGTAGVDVYGGSVGRYNLVPIGLDWNTPYTPGQLLTLHRGQIGPGNWDTVALGGTGGDNLRENIANGYSGPIGVGDWIGTEPGKKVGPIDQGFADRFAAANSMDPTGTYEAHAADNPRVIVVPMVDWQNPQGRDSVQVKAFAQLWITSSAGGTITAYYVDQVVPNSSPIGSTASFHGARGIPRLIR